VLALVLPGPFAWRPRTQAAHDEGRPYERPSRSRSAGRSRLGPL